MGSSGLLEEFRAIIGTCKALSAAHATRSILIKVSYYNFSSSSYNEYFFFLIKERTPQCYQMVVSGQKDSRQIFEI